MAKAEERAVDGSGRRFLSAARIRERRIMLRAGPQHTAEMIGVT